MSLCRAIAYVMCCLYGGSYPEVYLPLPYSSSTLNLDQIQDAYIRWKGEDKTYNLHIVYKNGEDRTLLTVDDSTRDRRDIESAKDTLDAYKLIRDSYVRLYPTTPPTTTPAVAEMKRSEARGEARSEAVGEEDEVEEDTPLRPGDRV